MTRILVFLYGSVSYAVFLATLLYAIGFLGNFGVPKSIDSGPQGPFPSALFVNLGLLSVFAVQHSVMARQWFKRAMTRLIPEPAERATYVLLSSLALLLLFWQWRPMGGMVWDWRETAAGIAMWTGYGLGLSIVLISTFLINHFDLFGLRQVWLCLLRRPYTPIEFRTPFFYKYVRHPLYVGWLLAFWCTPVMTAAHLVFALMTTAYILVAIQLEERDLITQHGQSYERYREQVPMLLPSRRASVQ